jgi:molybdopterin molybdotransferase
VARQAELLPVDVAQQRILDRFAFLGSEDVEVSAASGRVLAADITSGLDIPPFANSSMDGFAVRSEDTSRANSSTPTQLTVVAHVAAGSPPSRRIGAGEAARIMTGGPLPPGADAVVPFEETDDRGEVVLLAAPVRSGACVRSAGQDVAEGVVVLRRGAEIHYPQIGLLSALGYAQVSVARKPRIGILSTGDELVVPGASLGPGQIYNSNSPMLAAAVAEAGGTPIPVASARDHPDSIAAALALIPDADLLLTSGGASVGDHDHIKDVLGSGGTVEFWRVRVRPGKPLLFGSFRGSPVLGLPGNPTSAAVTFELFVRPVIRTMLGAEPFRPVINAVVDERITHGGGRTAYVRVRLSLEHGEIHASTAGPQDSAMLTPLARADGLLVAAEERTEIQPGERADVIVWRLP